MNVIITGNIGVGKSHFSDWLTTTCAFPPTSSEIETHPYLEEFYRDMPRHAFAAQMFFLTQRLEKQKSEEYNAQNKANPTNTMCAHILQTHTLHTDAQVFALHLNQIGHLSKRDFATYWRLYQTLAHTVPNPQLIIYLEASLPTLHERIYNHGATYEASIPSSYLLTLNKVFNAWITKQSIPVLKIDTNVIDPTTLLDNPLQQKKVLEQLAKYGIVPPIIKNPTTPKPPTVANLTPPPTQALTTTTTNTLWHDNYTSAKTNPQTQIVPHIVPKSTRITPKAPPQKRYQPTHWHSVHND